MLLAQPKYDSRIDDILKKLLERYGPDASIGTFIVTETMVRDFLRGYEPEKVHPEYEDEETGILAVKGEASNKMIDDFFRAAENLLDHWTPETYNAARDKTIKHLAMKHFTHKHIRTVKGTLKLYEEGSLGDWWCRGEI